MTLRSFAGAVTLSLVAALAVPVAAQAHSRRCYRGDRYYNSYSYGGGYYRPYYYDYGYYSYKPYYYRSYSRPYYRSYGYYPRRHRSGVSFFFGF